MNDMLRSRHQCKVDNDLLPRMSQGMLKLIARETARMSWPNGMRKIAPAGTKEKVECYFATEFPIEELWECPRTISKNYDQWHRGCSKEIAKLISVGKPNNSIAIATKFLNLYMYQLMKFKKIRPLWGDLHLPIDGKINDWLLKYLRECPEGALSDVRCELKRRKPYQLSYCEYFKIQRAIRKLIDDINRGRKVSDKLTSRIELNCMWVLGSPYIME